MDLSGSALHQHHPACFGNEGHNFYELVRLSVLLICRLKLTTYPTNNPHPRILPENIENAFYLYPPYRTGR